ncbi:MAG: hypothetical protein HOQ45_19835, partial [Nocardioidaceae bacterium]|nr:hypothetical protein [Nocardioidaceae bacterium]
MRPILRPGTHVLSRADGALQVGLDPERALLLPDSAPVRGALSRLTGPDRSPADPDDGTLAFLDRHGQLLDEGDLLPLLRPGDPRTHAAAALARSRGTGSAAVWRS